MKSSGTSEHAGRKDATAADGVTVTGRPTLEQAEARIQEISSSRRQGFILVFFLKNVDVVNRRFGFAAGDNALQKFATYPSKNLVGGDQLFRWRGLCFVILAERFGTLETFRVEADKAGVRGPAQEVEGNGKSMLFRLTAITTV